MPRGAPLDSAVEICWNQHLVPFIEAQTDHDVAVALGLAMPTGGSHKWNSFAAWPRAV